MLTERWWLRKSLHTSDKALPFNSHTPCSTVALDKKKKGVCVWGGGGKIE